jgi:hypothetical protein
MSKEATPVLALREAAVLNEYRSHCHLKANRRLVDLKPAPQIDQILSLDLCLQLIICLSPSDFCLLHGQISLLVERVLNSQEEASLLPLIGIQEKHEILIRRR